MANSLYTPQSSGKMRSIEALRALAAFSVVLMHAANLMRVEHFSGHVGMGNVFDFGYVGVDVFFVLSGFIITFVHYREIGDVSSVPRYLWRRFSRIYPIYWFVLLLAIAITTAGRFVLGKELGFEIGISDIPGTFFLLMGNQEPKYVGVAWSLQYEVIFYIVFCLILVNGKLGWAILSIWSVLLLGKVFGVFYFELPANLDNAHCLQFLIGVFIGYLARRFSFPVIPGGRILALFFMVAAILFEVYGPFHRHTAEGRLAMGLATAYVLVTLVALENAKLISTPAWLAEMGAVSYSIYLAHTLFINLIYMVLLKFGLYHALPEIFVFVTAIVVAVAITAFLGRYVELPMVSLLKDRSI